MSAQDYPITTPYGQVAGYPLNNGFHNGIDYGCPMVTPVVVNGVTIGLSNNTGASTGPHLHVGKFVNGVVQNPGVGNGFSFNSAVVYDTGSDSTNGNFVRITGDGALWNYLHLEKVLVTKGQVLKGDIMASQDKVDGTTVALVYNVGLNRNASDQEVADVVKSGVTVEQLLRNVWASPEHAALLQKGVTRDSALEYLKANLK